MEHKKIIKELVKTIKRLSLNSTITKSRVTLFHDLQVKIQKRKVDKLTIKEKIALSEINEYMYYEGKMMAYLWVLQQLVGLEKTNELLLEDVLGDKKVNKYGARIK